MGKIRISEQEDAIVEEIIEAKLKAAEPEIRARKRTVVKVCKTYDEAFRWVAIRLDLAAEAKIEPSPVYQVRRRSDGFAVVLREWAK